MAMEELKDTKMNVKDSQHLQDSQEIFNLGLSWVEFSQLKDLMEHIKHRKAYTI